MEIANSSRYRFRRAIVLSLFVSGAVAGCGVIDGLPVLNGLWPQSAKIDVQMQRRGCSEFSRTVVFTATTNDADNAIQWFFTDGVSEVGQSVVHTFDESGEQQATVIVGQQIMSLRFSVPVRGDADGGPDPFGDTCIPSEGEQHVPQGTGVNYSAIPPASGPHYSGAGLAPIAPGFYEQTVAPEVWVHNLEHGDIVVLFDCDGDCPADVLGDLRSFLDSRPSTSIVTRYPGLPVPIVAVGWQVQRSFNSFDLAGLQAFHDRRMGQAPEG